MICHSYRKSVILASMASARNKDNPAGSLQKLLAVMEEWPHSWAGIPENDEPVGQGMLVPMREFMASLHAQGLSRKTLHRHRTSLWVIGGEVIRKLNYDESLLKIEPTQLLFQSVEDGLAPLVSQATPAEQDTFDATARKLLRFLSTQAQSTLGPERNR
jgi:hypothetical protein